MAARTDERQRQTDGGGEKQPMELLFEALEHYAAARGQRLVESAGERLSGLTGRLTDVADNGGGGLLPAIGLRKARGESTLKAAASAGAKRLGHAVTDAVGGGGKKKSGTKKFVHITESIDVGVPVDVAYNHWTEFEKFADWAKGVRNVDPDDEVSSDWKVKVALSSRSWKANIQTMVPDECIEWTSEGAKGTTRGVVTFHELGDRLTRIVVVVEYHVSGPIERIGNLWRAQGRRLRLDLKFFRHYVMFGAEEEPEGWRGEIRDGEVVREPGEAEGDEDEDEEEDEAEEEEEEDYDADDEEPPTDEEEDDEEDEDEYDVGDEDDEEDEDSTPRRRASRRA